MIRHEVLHNDAPSSDEQVALLNQGVSLDKHGRPLHPWRHRNVDDLPANNGRGKFYYWGPNQTVDPVVITNEIEPRILLVQRRDTGDWALPGGFTDPGEAPQHAASREVHEETGITIPEDEWHKYFHGPVDDPRSTLFAWPETTALVAIIKYSVPPTPIAGDDAVRAMWRRLDSFESLRLYGSHASLIQRALTHIIQLRSVEQEILFQ